MTTSHDYLIVPEPPLLDDYLRLREDSGLSPKSSEQGALAIAGSWSFLHAVDENGATVGMGRVVGDGGWYFVVADMAVLPEHQGCGLGGRMLDVLLDEIRERAPESAYVTLIADPPGRKLYESRGFTDVAPGRTGMTVVL